ncbi:mitochondrial carrier [Eremomyces bilateralis CBS 781.70]|uniref:Mitochondrial carrier n=1 Tax=Eremomyces bilateralis CBS 781.70 TaxID=1392243 RepID=A0A6G1FZ73_9PEZI|nr:mitochondrial carrier [Eremomyces bilateralis CBS 781.70]KAF1811078.1 mitochondrial carrier [Eremomyces bilateralis CBS 781.70]
MTFESKPASRQIPNPGEPRNQIATSSGRGNEGLDGAGNPGWHLAEKSSPFAKSWAHFVAGGAGGMTAATFTAPLDVLKTRLQSDFYQSQLTASRAARGIPPPESMPLLRASLLHIRETFQILFAVPRVEGWRALFKGLGPNLIGVVPARSINFFTYGNGKKVVSKHFNDGKETAWVHATSAACAGIITGTMTNPIWVIKTRLQLDKSNAEKGGGRQYRNALDCTIKTIRGEGIKGLYRGLSASYLGVTESTLQWVLYEQAKKRLNTREQRLLRTQGELTGQDSFIQNSLLLCASGGAKFFAAIITYPHEVVRTRLRQSPAENGKLKYTGLAQCFRLIFREEGMAALYGGLVPHMMRVVPSAAIMFGTYEAVLRLMGTDSKV